jgi:hypothetical protein
MQGQQAEYKVAVAYIQTWLVQIFSTSSVAESFPDLFDIKAASLVTIAIQSFVGKRSVLCSQKVTDVLNSSAWILLMSIPWSAEPTTSVCQSWLLSYFLLGLWPPSRRIQVNMTVQRKVFLPVAIDSRVGHV